MNETSQEPQGDHQGGGSLQEAGRQVWGVQGWWDGWVGHRGGDGLPSARLPSHVTWWVEMTVALS